MSRLILGSALAALGLCAVEATPAQAVVRYELQSQVYRDNFLAQNGSNPCGPDACQFPTPVNFTVSDAAISRGSISVRGSSSNLRDETIFFGDSADLLNLNAARDPSVQDLAFYGNFNLQVSFAPDQSVTRFSLDYNGDADNVQFRSISGNLVTTSISSDRFQPCGTNLCFITGRIEIPEPASVALLGFGLLGLAATRRRTS